MKQNVLVTGANGFVGKKLVHQLKENGYQVFEFTSSEGDISTADIPYSDISHIFHLAAKTFVPESWEEPKGFYQTNVMGTVNVLDFARKCGASVTLISSYVYGPPEELPVSENHPVGPYNPYCHTKILSEEIANFYNDKYDVNVAIIRPFNIIGSGQNTQFLIPKIVDHCLDPNRSEIELMSLNPKRDYIHVNDVVDALIKTINFKGIDIFNVGSGESYSVAEIVEFIQEIAGTNKKVISSGQDRKNEVMDVVADITKIKKALNWAPSLSLKESLSLIIQDSLDSK